MKALVTGGAGFIGSHLVEHLLSEGYQVSVLDDLSTGLLDNLSEAQANGATLYLGSITDADAVNLCFDLVQPDLVFHLGAQIDVRSSVADPQNDWQINVHGTKCVADAALRHQVKSFLFTSTCAVYGGSGEIPIDEDWETNPESPYGAHKLAAEHMLLKMNIENGLAVTILRFANAYGPRQGKSSEGGVISIFKERIIQGENLIVYGDGEQTRDFIFVDDIVAALVGCAQVSFPGIFNVGSGQQVSINELIVEISEVHNSPVEKEFREARAGEVHKISLNSSKLQQLIDWKPQTSLADGLRKVLQS